LDENDGDEAEIQVQMDYRKKFNGLDRISLINHNHENYKPGLKTDVDSNKQPDQVEEKFITDSDIESLLKNNSISSNIFHPISIRTDYECLINNQLSPT
jgi:hypothetical protein